MFPIHDTIPRQSPPIITWLIIGVNSIVFFIELNIPEASLERLFYLFGVVPARYHNPAWASLFGLTTNSYWPFFTSMFLHGGWLHFIGNMWVLWIFGDNVEDRLGRFSYLIFYILCGLIAGITHCLINPHSTVPTIGASGAIAGVMGAYFLFFPYAKIITLIPIFFFPFFFELPAVLFIGIWFYIQLFSGTLSLATKGSYGGIAWWAHIGGFISGIIFGFIFVKFKPKRRLCADERTPWGINWPACQNRWQ
ncbi:MAG: rhomboid family intramembrane serine protease [Deltaproteobacteria bacterium]|nr:rhomboid family intramembrane serine protease [Deltaproteobacteria bacterium]RLA89086.1 MAG: rhomboid family intramembrane serine protease [Deltaproteobacteria bacterium]